MIEKESIEKLIVKINEPWKPLDVVKFNNQIIRLAMFYGEYHWHKHEEEDECFLVLKGNVNIEIRNKETIQLKEGEFVVVPKSVFHKPTSKEKSYVLLIEPEELKSSGD